HLRFDVREKAAGLLDVERLEAEFLGEGARLIDLMLVVLEDDEVPFGDSAGAEEGAHISQDRVPLGAAPVNRVDVSQAVDAEAGLNAELGDIRPPIRAARRAVRKDLELKARIGRAQVGENFKRVAGHGRIAVVSAEKDAL